MAETTILVHMFLAFTLFGIAKGDCNACPAPSYLSCPTTASISAYSWNSYSNWCDDSSSYVTINSIQVAQGDGDDDSFKVTVMDEDGYNNYENGRSYQYYVDIGTGDSSATCYQSSSSINFAPGTKIYTVIKCDNWLETCNLRIKIDTTCHSTDPCSGVSCGSNGYCTNGLCVCNQGYSGAQCQNYIDPCAETFCDHGYCTDGLCVCYQGYSGAQCENYIDPCAGTFCDHGYCTDGLCVCNQGYSGAQCEKYIDPCAGTFCDHGYCTDGLCVCNQGYSGAQCENYIDPCAGTFCGHGYCTDGLCVCNQGYSGAQCENYIDPCAGTFCDQGYCTDGLCVCNQGYSGAQCEDYIDPCAGTFCDHGYCTDGLCVCNQGYSGAQCENSDESNHQKSKIIIAASSAGGALLLLLLISCGIAAALRSRRRRSPQVTMVSTVPYSTDPKLALLSAMEQQQ